MAVYYVFDNKPSDSDSIIIITVCLTLNISRVFILTLKDLLYGDLLFVPKMKVSPHSMTV